MITTLAMACPKSQPRRRAPRLLALALLLPACEPAAPAPQGPAHRVLSQTVLGDELLWDLGPAARARVVGVSVMADDPRYCRVANQWPAELPRLAATTEGLLARAPDLAVIASYTAPETRALLAANGVRLLELGRSPGFADYRRDLRTLAAAVESTPVAEARIAELDARLAVLAAHRPSPAPGVISWGDGYAATGATSFADIARAAGLDNLPERAGLSGHVPVAMEQLLAWDPAYIVIACPAARAEDPACRAAERDFIASGPGLSATRAAREHGVIAVPARDLASTGEGMLITAELLQARVLAHP
jgi:iron complex transport system substrate-binding protein